MFASDISVKNRKGKACKYKGTQNVCLSIIFYKKHAYPLYFVLHSLHQ